MPSRSPLVPGKGKPPTKAPARARSRGPEGMGPGKGGSVGARLDHLEREVAILRAALNDVLKDKTKPDADPDFTLYGIPVILAPGKLAADITAAINELPRGLGSEEVINRLTAAKLLARV